MFRLNLTVSTLAVLASVCVADGDTFPILFQPLAGSEGFQARAPGLQAQFQAGGFDLHADGALVRVRFEGSKAQPTGATASATRINRLVGRSASQWSVGETAWSSLLYADVWPGVDVRVHSYEGRIEYDLELAPQADLSSAILRFEGSGPLSLAADGALVVPTESGPLFLAPPTSWEVSADGTPLKRESCFVLMDEHRVRMTVDGWTGENTLIVDPVLVWSRYVGGAAGDEATATAVAPDGSIFVTGWTRSGNFPVTSNTFDDRRQSEEGFLFKLNPDGSSLEWVTFFGGRDVDRGLAVTVDPVSGNPIVVGRTQSADFPATAGAFRTGRDGVRDGFVARFSNDGRQLVWATYLGGSSTDEIVDVEVAANGDVYLTGTTRSGDFPVTAGSAQTTIGGRDDAFFTRLAQDGRSLIGSTFIGGARDEVAGGLTLDGTDVWLVGTTRSSNFPVTPGALDTTRNDHDAYVVRLSADAVHLEMGTYLGGRERERATDVALFSYLGVVIVGQTNSNDFPVTADGAQTSRRGSQEGFLVLLNRAGNEILHGTFLGGSADETVTSVAVDRDDAVWMSGMSYSSDWSMSDDAQQPNLAGAGDAFVMQYDPRTGENLYASFLGGAAEDQALGLALDPNGGTAVVVGYARAGLSNLADNTPAAPSGARDAFVARFDHGLCGTLASVEDLGGGCGMLLEAEPARLGRPFHVKVDNAPANATGFFLASAPNAAPQVLPGGCLAMIDVSRMWMVGTFQTDSLGAYETVWNVSRSGSSCGTGLTLQGLVYAAGQGPGGFGWLSNGLGFVLGD